MLNAYISEKIRTGDAGSDDAIEGTRGVKLTEDVLTSSVFERLLYIPEPLFWSIILNATRAESDVVSLLATSGSIVRTHLWKNYALPVGRASTYGKRQEPDRVVKFENLCLIIEAKREHNSHDANQWTKQILSVGSSTDGSSAPLVHLAIGGFGRTPSPPQLAHLQSARKSMLSAHSDLEFDVTYIASICLRQ